jgi:hypothetical protein
MALVLDPSQSLSDDRWLPCSVASLGRAEPTSVMTQDGYCGDAGVSPELSGHRNCYPTNGTLEGRVFPVPGGIHLKLKGTVPLPGTELPGNAS